MDFQQDAEVTLQLDRACVRQALAGDQYGFAELVRRYDQALYRCAYRTLGDAREAEDAIQECLIRAYYHLGQYDMQRPFKSWLLSICSHYCIDRLRRRRASEFPLNESLPLLIDAGVHHYTLDDDAVTREQREAVKALLNRLSEDDRAVIMLYYWNDFSYREIAAALRTTTQAVKARLFRARHALASQMPASIQ